MTLQLRLKIVQWAVQEWIRSLKRKIWNKHIKLAWSRLWIRKDEFHPSLSFDDEAFQEMNAREQEDYAKDLESRRSIAHRKSLECVK